jgi:alkanesulfonate monooxygenase SsuD/methylene tetrahydromethanopterin reductase-like flavin-dependent oxidoreductase (luciferase family)
VLSPEDQAAVRRLRDAYDSYQHATAASRHRELVPDRFVDMLALAGDPAEVLEQVGRVRSVPEITRIIILPQNPGQGFIERETVLRMFAEQVMARLG